MAPSTQTQTILLSPAELSYIHSSLSLIPPIRPDSRTATQFRPLTAERDVLAGTNGSARVCFADGSEAVVGVKAEVEKSKWTLADKVVGDDGTTPGGQPDWVQISVEIPGLRDDDSVTVVLASLLGEAIRADGELLGRLRINARYHWKIYVDILLLSAPLSYPLPLLSLTTHLALLSTRLPKLKSEKDEDPLFDDDWNASVHLYTQNQPSTPASTRPRPPITLLVISVGSNILFDPSAAELAVAEVILAVSVAEVTNDKSSTSSSASSPAITEAMDLDSNPRRQRTLRLLSLRTIDPPARLTPPGVPNFLNTATGASQPQIPSAGTAVPKEETTEGIWRAPVGGAKRKTIAAMAKMALERGGVTQEVLDGLETVE